MITTTLILPVSGEQDRQGAVEGSASGESLVSTSGELQITVCEQVNGCRCLFRTTSVVAARARPNS
jgi:hypothetical protein